MKRKDLVANILAQYKSDFGTEAKTPTNFLWLDNGLVVLVDDYGRDFDGDPNDFTGDGTIGKALAFYQIDGEHIRQRTLQ